MRPAGLGGAALEVAADQDPRAQLVDWMTRPDNPFFARTAEKFRDLYPIALAREPARKEWAALLGHLDKKKANIREAYADIP